MVRADPSRSTSPSLEGRAAPWAWVLALMSPTFVEKNRAVIRLLELFRPASRSRPVNDPFSCPKSSDSISSSGIAAQFTCTNRSRLRRLLRWIARANQFLADAALALNEHRRVGGRGAADRLPSPA